MSSKNVPLINFEKITDKDTIKKDSEIDSENFSVLINEESKYSSHLSKYINVVLKYHNIEGKSSSNNSDPTFPYTKIGVIKDNKTFITLEQYINLFGLNEMVSNEKNEKNENVSGEEDTLARNILSVNDVIKLIFDFTISLNILKDIGLSILKININDFHVIVPSNIYNKSINNSMEVEDKRLYLNKVIFIYTGSIGNDLYPIDDKDNIYIEREIEFSNTAPEIKYFNENKTLPYNFNIRTSYYVIALFVIDLLFGTSTEDDESSSQTQTPEKLLSLLEPLYYTKLYYFLLRCLQPNINDRYFLFV